MTLDEIYESFLWDSSYTEDEYEAKIADGINEGKTYRYMYPFIQPILPISGSAIIWEPCARIVASKTNEELAPYLYELFKWIQDLNWPGAETIFNRLLDIPFPLLEEQYSRCKQEAEKSNDFGWLLALKAFKEQAKP